LFAIVIYYLLLFPLYIYICSEQEGHQTSIEEMIIYLTKLAEIDTTRTKYWNKRILKHELNSNKINSNNNDHMD
jgi:hypothetical protein